NVVIDHTVVVYASRIVGSHQNARFSVVKKDIVYEADVRGAVPGGDSFGFVAVDDIIPNACREAADVWRRRIFHVNAVRGLASMRIQIVADVVHHISDDIHVMPVSKIDSCSPQTKLTQLASSRHIMN